VKEYTIDINCDLGEGLGNEAELLPLISSCSIACGGHAGDKSSMEKAILLAKKHGVKIGAHPSYPDKENFGRISLDLPADELKQSIRAQLKGFNDLLKRHGALLHHIKPHGALYNDMAEDRAIAKIFIDAVRPFMNNASLYAPCESALATTATESGIEVSFEAFADRNYTGELSLVPRSNPSALITRPQVVLEHVVRMVRSQEVKTLGGEIVPIKASTFCVHGDTPTALQILTYLSEELPGQRIIIEK